MKTKSFKKHEVAARMVLSGLLLMTNSSLSLFASDYQSLPGGTYQPVVSPDQVQETPSLNQTTQTSQDFLQASNALQAVDPRVIDPSDSQTPQNMQPGFKDVNDLFIGRVTVAPRPEMASIQATGRGGILSLSTDSEGWAGGGFTFDATPGFNLDSVSELSFALRGDFQTVKLELVDFQDQKSFVHLTGIQKDKEQVWSVSSSLFQGIDRAHVRLAYFIVEGQNQSGQLEINIHPGNQTVNGNTVRPDQNLSVNTMTALPELSNIYGSFPDIVRLADRDAVSNVNASERGLQFQYDTKTVGWSGAGWTYQHFYGFGQALDLSGANSFMLGLKGDVNRAKVEVKDLWGQQAVLYLEGIEADREQVWNIPISLLTGIDKSRIQNIFFIVEGANQQGSLTINRVPSGQVIANLPPAVIQPSASLTTQDLTELPHSIINGSPFPGVAPLIPPGASAAVSGSGRGLSVDYTTSDTLFAGGGLIFDYFGTPQIETTDLSGYEQFVFGLKGTLGRVKVEFIDAQDKKSVVYLEGISSGEEKVWQIPASVLRGADMSQIRIIYFIAEGDHVSGSLEVNHVPQAAQALQLPNWVPFVTLLGERDTARGPVRMYYYNQRGNQYTYFMNMNTYEWESYWIQGVAMFNQLKAISPDGAYAILSDSLNGVGVVPLPGTPKENFKKINLPVPDGQGPTLSAVKMAAFAGNEWVALYTESNVGYYLNVKTGELIPNTELKPALSNPDYMFRKSLKDPACSGNHCEHIFQVFNLKTGVVTELAVFTPGQGEGISGMHDVSPDGSTVIFSKYALQADGQYLHKVTLKSLQNLSGEASFDQTSASANFLKGIQFSGDGVEQYVLLQTQVVKATGGLAVPQPYFISLQDRYPFALKPAKSNSDFAFYDGTNRDCVVHNLPHCGSSLAVFNMKTGKGMFLAERSSQPLGWEYTSSAYDVSPDGRFVIFESGNRPYYGLYNALIKVKSLDDANPQEVSLPVTNGSSWNQVIYAADGTPTVISQVTYPSGAVFKRTYNIGQNIGGMSAVLKAVEMVKKGSSAYFSSDKKFFIQVETYPFRSGLESEVLVYQVANNKPVKVSRALTFPSSQFANVKLNKLYKRNNDVSYLSVGLDADHYNSTLVLNLKTGQEFRFDGAAISVTFQGNFATYTVLTQDGIQKKIKVNLDTLKIVS